MRKGRPRRASTDEERDGRRDRDSAAGRRPLAAARQGDGGALGGRGGDGAPRRPGPGGAAGDPPGRPPVDRHHAHAGARRGAGGRSPLRAGILRAAADVGAIVRDPAQPNRLDVQLSTALDGEERWRRYTYASSSCGICGVESLDALVLRNPPVTADCGCGPRPSTASMRECARRSRVLAPRAASTPRRYSRRRASYGGA